ncbi:MAG: ribosome-associated translation inhibitor RaiA, partial [Planctomycetes bacterium]|nr:ribosome-associated translation inhibitor RaiA [Planctomycetota bacterium]
MDFEIIGRQVEITPEIKEYVTAKLEKVPKFFGRIHGLKGIFSMDGAGYQAEFVANVIKGETLVAKAVAKDIYSAVDIAAAKIEKQLRRYKDRLQEHRPKAEAETAEPVPAE